MGKVPQDAVNRCTSLLAEVEARKDGEQVLSQIQPTILKMRNGQAVFSQIQKLVIAREKVGRVAMQYASSTDSRSPAG